MIEAVFFDMDGVLFDTEGEAINILQNEAIHFGYKFTTDFLQKCAGRDKKGCEELYYQEFGKDFPFEKVWQYCLQRIQEKAILGELKQKKGAKELLVALNKNSIKCVLVTSSESKEAYFLLEKAEFLPYFSAVFGGEGVKQGKPAPDIYLMALEKTGIASENVIVIEDSIQGVKSALNANLSVIMVPDVVKPDDELIKKSLAVIDSLEEVVPILKEMNLWI